MKNLTILTALFISTITYAGIGHGHSHGDEKKHEEPKKEMKHEKKHSHGGKGGHSHAKENIDMEKSIEIAKTHITRLISKEKINASWEKAVLDKSEKKDFDGKSEWLITFDNEKGVKGKKLYIFLSLTGEFVAANFSGK